MLQCRACLTTVSTECTELVTSLNGEKSYLECFIECTQLEAALDDDLPHILCQICSMDLLKAYNFIKIAHKSDAVLRSSIGKVHVENESFAEEDIDNMEIVMLEELREETNEQYLNQYNLNESQHDFDEKNYSESEDDAEYFLEPSISDSQWACLECRRLLDGSVPYEGHMNLHRNLRPYKCLKCKTKTYRCLKALDRHKKLRHSNDQEMKLENDVQNKKQNIQDNKGFIALSNCNFCSKVFESAEILHLHHLVYHNPSSNETCGLCNKNVTDNFDLNKHLCNEHPIEYKKIFNGLKETFNNDEACIKNPKAKEGFIENEDYNDNLNNSAFLGKQQFFCSSCLRHFKNQRTLKEHEKIHKESSKYFVYICTDCDRPFKSMTLLEQHRRNSHKEREYNCNICGNSFKLKNQLKSHMKLHLEKNIKCPFCDKKYARRFDLNVHLRSHTGDLPYECHLCDKKFAIKVRLTYHLQKHYGIKHNCKECGAEFNSRQKLKAHSFKHTGMPYRCKICDDHGFPTRDVFKRHLLRVHKATISEEALLEMFQRNTGKSTRIRQVNICSE